MKIKLRQILATGALLAGMAGVADAFGSGGNIITFDPPGAGTGANQGTGCYSDCPVALNDLAEMAGTFIDVNYVLHGYLRSPDGKVTTFDPAGSAGTQPQAINNEGTIVGVYVDAANVNHAFVRTRGE